METRFHVLVIDVRQRCDVVCCAGGVYNLTVAGSNYNSGEIQYSNKDTGIGVNISSRRKTKDVGSRA